MEIAKNKTDHISFSFALEFYGRHTVLCLCAPTLDTSCLTLP